MLRLVLLLLLLALVLASALALRPSERGVAKGGSACFTAPKWTVAAPPTVPVLLSCQRERRTGIRTQYKYIYFDAYTNMNAGVMRPQAVSLGIFFPLKALLSP